MNIYPELATDFYKTGHIFQYPKGTEYVYSNWTCRSDRWAEVLPDFDHKVVNFNWQGVCRWLFSDLWKQNFFDVSREIVLDRYKRRMDSSLGVGSVPVDHIADLHKLGYLPLSIKALPEGCRVDIRVPMATLINTHPDFFWVTNYIETQLSAEIYKAQTSATIAHEYRRLFNAYARTTGYDPAFCEWQGHDFSFRGMSGITDATQSGAGHLLSFRGTDTIPAIDYLEDYYYGEGLIGGSVPATEHSVMCAGGYEDEIETFRRLIVDCYPRGIVSIVSDTWDFWKVMTEFTVELKDLILARDGKVVFRPDSGDPVKIIVGNHQAEPGSPEFKGAWECLWDVFGGTRTAIGCKLLDPHVGLIYGDSISLKRAEEICGGLTKKGFAPTVVFGIGSFTYQHVTRDTFGTAVKATWAQINGQPFDLYKDPKTDNGVKKSACGLLRVEFEDGNFVLYDRQTPEQEQRGLLKEVFRDGRLRNPVTFSEIRKRLSDGGRP